jgi:signal transduction histidine kinase
VNARNWCRQRSRDHRLVFEILVFGTMFGATMRFVETHMGQEASGSTQYHLTAPGIAVSAVVYASMLGRRRYPTAVVAVATAGVLVSLAVSSSAILSGLAMIVALGSMARRVERNHAVGIGLVVGAAVICGGVAFTSGPWYSSANLAVTPWVGLAIAAGQSARHKHAYVEALKERALRAEQSRDEEARRSVHAERLRIARELHDAVGHHVALINVQAGAAEFMLDDRPDQARNALAHIRRASREALEELSITVGLLRQPGDREPTEPAPGLARLDELIGSFASAGLPVTREVAGE